MRGFFALFPAVALALLCLAPQAAAADVPNPTLDYEPRGTRTLEGSVGIGLFTYRPFTEGKVKYDTEIYTESPENITLADPVAEHVRRGTGMELYHAGVRIDQEAKFAVGGEILELRVDDTIYPLRWVYSVRYTIIEPQSGAVIYGVACPDIKAESPRGVVAGEYADVIEQLVFAGYECLIADPRIPEFLSAE